MSRIFSRPLDDCISRGRKWAWKGEGKGKGNKECEEENGLALIEIIKKSVPMGER